MSGLKPYYTINTSTGGVVATEATWESANETARRLCLKNPNITYHILKLQKVLAVKPMEIEERWPDKEPEA